MSLPHIPDIHPHVTLTREDALHLLLASIALEEIGLSHILNAEGEKIQAAVEQDVCISELLAVNRSVRQTLRAVIQKNMLLHFKLEDVLEAMERERGKRKPQTGDCNEE